MIEKRLYVVLPANIYIPQVMKTVPMSCGRLMAQAIHVGSKLKIRQKMDPELRTTTIVLKVADSFELCDVLKKVVDSKQPYELFLDDNEEVYGTRDEVLTGIACLCSKKKGKSLFYGIPSWTCGA
jgi:hypothetical protein